MIDGSVSSAPTAARPRAQDLPALPAAPPQAWSRLRHLVEHTIPAAVTSPVGLAWLFTFTTAVITAFQVRDYYLTHLPHYDSIGAYLNAYIVMNLTVSQGLLAGVKQASISSLSWLEPFYAIPFSWTPYRTPAPLITLNFLLMALTQLAIADWCRLNEYSRRHQIVILLLPYLPGAFYTWDGGLPDWRRDAQLNILLIGDLFLSLAYIQRPTAWRGVALGAMVGLTQLSRDNALSMVALVVFPAIVWALVSAFRGRGWLWLLQIAWRPLLVFVLIASPYYYMTLGTTIFRYTNLVWGHGEDRLASLAQFWTSPSDVLFGGTGMFNGHEAVAEGTRQILLGALAVVAVCLVTRVVVLDAGVVRKRRSQILLGSGAFIVVAVILYNTVGLGYGAQYHGVPFFPVLVGLTAIFAGLTDLVRSSESCCRQTVGRLALGASLIGFLWMNVMVRTPGGEFDPVGEDSIRAAREAALQIGALAGRRPVAVFWFDGYSVYHINYYLTQAGRDPIVNADKIDGPLRNGETPDEWFKRIRESTLTRAGVILVNAESERYTNPAAPAGLFRDGQPFIQSLFRERRLSEASRFQIGPYKFAILDNRRVTK